MGDDEVTPDEELFLRDVLGQSVGARSAGQGAEDMAALIRTEDGRTSRLRRLLIRPSDDEKAWVRGAEGERATARRLSELPKGWFSFHDISVGERGSNIDHLVVGPNGVFTINTKNLSGKVWAAEHSIMVNGQRTDYLRNARHEAKRASRLLSATVERTVEVRPVLAVIAPSLTVNAGPIDVGVVEVGRLTSWLRSQPTRLPLSSVIEIAARADDPFTWQPHLRPAPSEPPSVLPDHPTHDPVAPSPQTAAAPLSAAPVGQLQAPLPPPPPAPPTAGPCPCGGTMFLRQRRSDGNHFYGCTEFPRCRRTRPI